MAEGEGEDKANRIENEDSRGGGVANAVVGFHGGEEGAGRAVIEAVAEAHQAGA